MKRENGYESDNENESDQEMDLNIFFPLSIEKLHRRFPVEDTLNFFDPSSDFTLDVSEIMLREQLAKGSYGVVYNGIMKKEKYAVKIEDLRTGVEEQVNILSELTILQSFPHESLVKYYGTGYLSKSLDEAKVMIVMELCENGALREKIQEDIPWNLAVRLASDISSGLQFLHENNIVHRDIKTTNILVDKDWRAKICDFSFACHVNSFIKQEFVYGTDEFMSPEIAMGEDFGVASDIFSFGIVLCELITKQEPSSVFLKRTAKNNCFALPEDELRAAVLVECPESLEALTIECCHLEPDQRPTATECQEWLESLLNELGGPDLKSTIESLTSEKSALVGVSPIREGTVIYPKTKDPKVASFLTRLPSIQNIPTKSPGVNPSETNSRITYLEVQVQELRAENSCLTREVASLNIKFEELLKVMDFPPLTRLNSSGRLSIGGGGSNTATPRTSDPSQHHPSHSIPSTPITPHLPPSTNNLPENTENSDSEKDRLIKKLFSEIEYLKFRFSKLSSDVSLLKAKDFVHSRQVEEKSDESDGKPSQSSQEITFAREVGVGDRTNPMRFDQSKNDDEQASPKWTISRNGDSPLVRMSSGDFSKPSKRESPTSYGLSPDQSSANSRKSPFSGLVDVEGIESPDDDDDVDSEDLSENSGNLHEPYHPNIDLVVQSFLDVVGKCSEITQQSQSTLKSLNEGHEKSARLRSSDETFHRGTRASANSPFHYSPHPGFLSQFSPKTRQPKLNQNSNDRSQSPTSTVISSVTSSRPSVLSQPFQKVHHHHHGVSNSPNKLNKTSLRSHDNYFEEESEEEFNQTPPHISSTWRNVQSKTPPNRQNPSYTHQTDLLKHKGKMVLDEINSTPNDDHQSNYIPPPSTKPNNSKKKNLNQMKLSNSKNILSTSPGHSKSTHVPSSSLHEMLLADQERTAAAKAFFQADLVRDAIFRKDSQHAVYNPSPRPTQTTATVSNSSRNRSQIAVPIGQITGK